MLRFTIQAEPSTDILCFNRPLPPETTDLFLYVEDQIGELLSAEEALSDTLYRFVENDSDILIAVARIQGLRRKPLPANALCYRIPAAIAIWLKARTLLKPETPSLVYAKCSGSSYVLWADARWVRRVYQINDEADAEREIMLSIENLRERYSLGDFPLKLYGAQTISETLAKELRGRSIHYEPVTLPATIPIDTTVFEQWDFRLGSEASSQELARRKLRTIQACTVTAACVTLLWLLLYSAGMMLGRVERRSIDTWRNLQGSLKEINYLQKHTRQCVSEITLCQKLSGKRTNRALVLEQIAATRPESLTLEKLQISERRKKLESGAKGGPATLVAADAVSLKGCGKDPSRITEWMELLLKSAVFTSVNLVSLKNENNRYYFQIECGLPPR